MTTFTQYQKAALRTANRGAWRSENDQLNNAALGLSGEGGEVADIVKKFLYQGHDLEKDKLKDEAGDVLWYLALLADALGLTLEQIAERNIEKLEKRYPVAFAAELSWNRTE